VRVALILAGPPVAIAATVLLAVLAALIPDHRRRD
jgi:hypothetical protein